MMLALTPSLAAAQTGSACLTDAEAQGLVQYALPHAIEQIGTTCGTTLPASAYLTRSGSELRTRYSTAATAVEPVAQLAFAKMIGVKPADMAKLGKDGLRGILSLAISQAVAGKVKPADCVLLDAVLEQLAPLPPENMVRLIGIALRASDKSAPPPAAGIQGNPRPSNPFRLCPVKQGA
jgi:hypothetical protein